MSASSGKYKHCLAKNWKGPPPAQISCHSVSLPSHNKCCLHCYKRYLKCSSPLENCSSGNGKRPCWCWNILSLAHTGILHSSMLDMSSGMEECKITAWARYNMSLTHAVILHSSMPEMSEECLIFCILCADVLGNCGLGV